jgi:hypothetical protein
MRRAQSNVTYAFLDAISLWVDELTGEYNFHSKILPYALLFRCARDIEHFPFTFQFFHARKFESPLLITCLCVYMCFALISMAPLLAASTASRGSSVPLSGSTVCSATQVIYSLLVDRSSKHFDYASRRSKFVY